MRKLAWATFGFVAAIIFRHYFLTQSAVLYVMALLGVAAGLAAFVQQKQFRTGLLLVCVFALLGLARYELQVSAKVTPAEKYVGETVRISAELTEYPVVYGDYTRYTVRLETEGLPNTKVMLYDYEPGDLQLKPGDRIRTLARFRSALVSGGDTTDNYVSKGVYLLGTAREPVIYAGESSDNWKYGPLYFGKSIRDALNTHMTARTSAFMKALLTGEKTDLYAHSDIYHTITRSGISHVVAVSGMHVSFMVGLAVLLFGGGRGWLISIGFAALFALMTGLSPSVMRALLMQTLFLTAPLLRRESDDITSICFPLLVLMLINPFSIASVSLQLSFGAMWGIILLTPRMAAWFEERGKGLSGFAQSAYRYVYGSVTMSLGATVFTVPLCAYYFASVALLSPLTNLLVLWLVPICFAGGFAVYLLSFGFAPMAGICGMVLSLAVEMIYALAGLVSNSAIASVYLPPTLLAAWFVITYLLIGASMFTRIGRLVRPVVSIAVSLALLLGLGYAAKLYYRQGITVGAVDVGQGQSIVLMSGEDTLVVDCGGSYDAGERTVEYLYAHGCGDVDMLVLTHFDKDHVSGVTDLLTQIKVKELVFCGLTIVSDQTETFEAIKACAAREGTALRMLNRTSGVDCGNVDVNAFVTEEGLVVLARAGEFELLVTGDADMEVEEQLVRQQHLSKGDCLIVGHHGSKYSTGDVLLDAYAPEICIISSGYNTYGHPTAEVLDRLEARNVIIYRTDTDGDISLRIE